MPSDPTVVDPKHYKVDIDNKDVRVLRISVGAREKTPMHSHPASILVALTDAHVRFTFPDGRAEEVRIKAGDAVWMDAVEHAGENLDDRRIELIQIEQRAAAKTVRAA